MKLDENKHTFADGAASKVFDVFKEILYSTEQYKPHLKMRYQDTDERYNISTYRCDNCGGLRFFEGRSKEFKPTCPYCT